VYYSFTFVLSFAEYCVYRLNLCHQSCTVSWWRY